MTARLSLSARLVVARTGRLKGVPRSRGGKTVLVHQISCRMLWETERRPQEHGDAEQSPRTILRSPIGILSKHSVFSVTLSTVSVLLSHAIFIADNRHRDPGDPVAGNVARTAREAGESPLSKQ